jgi:hypothetical protein
MNGVNLSGNKFTVDIAEVNSAVEAHNLDRNMNIPTFDTENGSFQDFINFLNLYYREVVQAKKSLKDSIQNS